MPDLITKSGDSIGPAVDLVARNPSCATPASAFRFFVHSSVFRFPCRFAQATAAVCTRLYVFTEAGVLVIEPRRAEVVRRLSAGVGPLVIRRKLHIIMTCY